MNVKVSSSTVILVAVLALLLFGQVQSVAADKPDREHFEEESFILSGFCPFDVGVDDLMNKGVFTTFFDHDGNPKMMLITGALKVRLTNMDTGKSLDLNIPGPGRILPHEDGSETLIAMGPWMWFLFPEWVPDFQPRFFYTTGKLVWELDDEGNLVQLMKANGRLVDLCAALAD